MSTTNSQLENGVNPVKRPLEETCNSMNIHAAKERVLFYFAGDIPKLTTPMNRKSKRSIMWQVLGLFTVVCMVAQSGKIMES